MKNPQRHNDKNMAKKKNSGTNKTSKPPNPQKIYSAKSPTKILQIYHISI